MHRYVIWPRRKRWKEGEKEDWVIFDILDKHSTSKMYVYKMETRARLTLNGAVLFQEGGRARQGVRCCGGSWGDSRGARRHDGVTGRRVLTSIPVDLHILEQLILFNTPGERERK